MAKKYNAGENITQNLSASGLNRMVDAAEGFARGQLGGPADSLRYFSTGVDVQVRNNSGTDWVLGGCATIYDMEVSNIDVRNFYFKADTTDVTEYTSHKGRAGGVLLQAIPNGKIGPMRISGVVPARVNITSTSHYGARFKTGQAYLESCAAHADARIFWQPGSTGIKTCAVLLNLGPAVHIGITTADIAKDASGNVTRYDGSNRASVSITDVVYNWFIDVASNTHVAYIGIDGTYYLIAAACDPEGS